MNLEIKVSVIIPTYNREDVLKRAINSVLSQTYKNYELIIVDDGSTDKTKNLISANENIIYLYQQNQGVSAARNFGVCKSKGKFIAFLDSDDEWHPEKLEKQIRFLENDNSLRAVHTNELWVRNGISVNQPKRFKKGGGDQFIACLDHCIIAPSSILIEKTLFNLLGGFRNDYEVCEDFDLWLKLTSLYRIGHIEEDLITKYGGHEDQLSTRFVAMDYWRIKSLDWVSANRNLSAQQVLSCKKVILKKAKILLKGYKKHNNLKNFNEIFQISEKHKVQK